MSLKNIKTPFFIEMIFEYLNDGVKLKLVTYNKRLQKIIEINILDYRIYSGKYIEFETNGDGKGKELDSVNGQILFEGEYKNRKRNGQGKEYNSEGKLIFEGEYLNGKRNGKGKEYNEDGELIYEGEYSNGKRWDVKGYDRYGHITNELKKGAGFIKELFYNEDNEKLMFEGEHLNGERHGKGKEYNEYGLVLFEGEYLYGKRWDGKGYGDEGRIELTLEKGKGNLKVVNSENKVTMEKTYLNGLVDGICKIYTYEGNFAFEGEYKSGKRHGVTKTYDKDNKLNFDGVYLYDKKRRGKEYTNGKLEYEGEYLFDAKWNGKGYDENGNLLYEINNGNGKIKEYSDYNGKLIFDGEILNGKRTGKGKEYNPMGELTFEGEYLKGKRNGKGKEYARGKV